MNSNILIAVKNQSSVVSDAAVKKALPSFQRQVSEHFACAWGVDATLQWVPKSKSIPKNAWLLGIFNNSDEAGALGYHDLTKYGQPLCKVFAKTTIDDGGLWTVTASHEILEMLADPNINLCAFDEHAHRLYAYEVCDAVEADALGYDIDGVTVSDFVLPGWFEPLHVGKNEQFAFKSKVRAPFELLAGGYISYYDLRGGGWQQLNAKTAKGASARVNARTQSAVDAGPGAYAARPAVGSRRERRRIPKTQWQRSTAD
jgi:hypothetical protein